MNVHEEYLKLRIEAEKRKNIIAKEFNEASEKLIKKLQETTIALDDENKRLAEDRDAEKEGARVLAEALANANKERKRLKNDLKELGLRLKGIGEGIEQALKGGG